MIILVLLLLASGTSAHEAPYRSFLREFDAGADCPRLFVLRNEAKRASTEARQEEMNVKLRSVQCFTSTSKRVPTGPANTAGFTVKEYRIYRAILDTPMSIPEAQSLRAVGKRHGLSAAQAKSAARKVQQALSDNNWFATPEAEIRHASDWAGERQ